MFNISKILIVFLFFFLVFLMSNWHYKCIKIEHFICSKICGKLADTPLVPSSGGSIKTSLYFCIMCCLVFQLCPFNISSITFSWILPRTSKCPWSLVTIYNFNLYKDASYKMRPETNLSKRGAKGAKSWIILEWRPAECPGQIRSAARATFYLATAQHYTQRAEQRKERKSERTARARFQAMENTFLYHKFFDAYLNYHSQNATKENQLVGKPMGSQFKLSLFIPLTRCFPSCHLYIHNMLCPAQAKWAHVIANNSVPLFRFLLISVSLRAAMVCAFWLILSWNDAYYNPFISNIRIHEPFSDSLRCDLYRLEKYTSALLLLREYKDQYTLCSCYSVSTWSQFAVLSHLSIISTLL